MKKRQANQNACSPLHCEAVGFRTSQKRARTEITLPKRFLLGGSIGDPLNLQSLNEQPIRAEFVYRDKIVDLLVPTNLSDPLNLNDDLTNSSSVLLANTQSERGCKIESDTSEVVTERLPHLIVACSSNDELKHVVAEANSSNCVKIPDKGSETYNNNKIVSPAVPQVSPKRKKYRGKNKKQKKACLANVCASMTSEDVKSKTSAKKYCSGNYPAYYGYRNVEKSEDPRLQLLSREIFEGKDVLDIGCNAGLVTLFVARDYAPRRILGLDVDPRLVESAKRNVRNFISKSVTDLTYYPNSMKSLYGPVSAGVHVSSDMTELTTCVFPHNVLFQVSDYVLGSNDELELQSAEYDVILALSVTKWIHLNHGDDGLRRAFCRMVRQLRPGGRLILEAQPWSSYKRKKKLTDKIFTVYKSIKFFPDQFIDYLLSNDVGFVSCELLGTPDHKSKGFQRAVYMLTKSSTVESL